jgi:SpoVK/Ycf46/Vps4 family AAA+-type ATPase
MKNRNNNNSSSNNLNLLIEELDCMTIEKEYPRYFLIPTEKSPKSYWIEYSNLLTMKYNKEVSLYSPNTMPEGDCIDNSTTDEMDKQIIGKKRKRRLVKVEVNNIRTLQDIIDLIDTYPEDPTIKYDIDLGKLHSISKPIRELNNMIGLDKLKESIVDQILYFAQNLHKSSNGKETMDYMHTVLYGPPGTGKTEVAMMMGNIYCGLGILKKGHFTKVTRSDLVAGYLGQTAIKTKKVINNALNGVLFIDEAYSLGHPDKCDSFAQECIDTLCEAASAHKDKLVIIIAGYEKELKERFFSWNMGLDSRFPWRHETTEYNSNELARIFRKKIHDSRWSCSLNTIELSEWFDKKKGLFNYFGRDMETLFSKTKISHAHRIFGQKSHAKRWVTLKDIEMGLQAFLSNRQENKKDNLSKELLATLYS